MKTNQKCLGKNIKPVPTHQKCVLVKINNDLAIFICVLVRFICVFVKINSDLVKFNRAESYVFGAIRFDFGAIKFDFGAIRFRLVSDNISDSRFVFRELGIIFLSHTTIYYTRAQNFRLRRGYIRRIVVTLQRKRKR